MTSHQHPNVAGDGIVVDLRSSADRQHNLSDYYTQKLTSQLFSGAGLSIGRIEQY